jgi:transcription elongation factor
MCYDLDFAEVEHVMAVPTPTATITKDDTRDPLEGKQILANGHFKGHRGIIKSTNTVRGIVQVELEAGQRLQPFKLRGLYNMK